MAEKKDKKKQDTVLTRDVVIRRRNHRAQAKGPSPLVKLKEVLEETTDKERFVGDTMFWKYFEDIDVERVTDTKSVEYMNLKVMFWETLAYILLLLVFTIYVFVLQYMEVYEARQEQINYWSGCESTDKCMIREVDDHRTFWTWMTRELVSRAFTEYDLATPCAASLMTAWPGWNDFSLVDCPRFFGPTMSNILLGSIRVRQMRVKKNQGCQVSNLIKHIYPDCYGAYTRSEQDTDEYYAKFAPYYLINNFKWSDAAATQQLSIAGALNTYGGDGFMFDLPTNRTESLMMLTDLWRWKWVDRATRAVIIEISAMNVNVNVIVNSRIIFEFGPTGSIFSKVDSNAAQALFFTTPSVGQPGARAVFVFQILVTVAFILYFAWVCYIFWRTCIGCIGQNPIQYLKTASAQGIGEFVGTVFNLSSLVFNHYLGYGWNVVDLIIQCLFWAHFGYRMDTYRAKAAERSLDPEIIGHPEHFMPLMKVLAPVAYANQTLAMLAMAMWIKLFKYLCMMGYFRTLVRIVEHCAKKLVLFAALLVIVYFAFGVAFFVGFGGTDERFSNFIGAFLVLFFLMVDGFMVESYWFLPGKPGMMPFLFLCYILCIYFVMTNIFVAIVLDTWATSKHMRENRRETPNPMKVFLSTWADSCWGMIKPKHKEGDEQLKPEDLYIKLNVLPGIVRRKWVEKKRQMQRVANENFVGLDLFPGMDLKGNKDEGGAVSDWMLPSSDDAFTDMQSKGPQKPMPIYDIPAKLLELEVSHSQLQRLMDEDEALPILLGTKSAVQVIRKFKGDQREAEESGAGGVALQEVLMFLNNAISELEKNRDAPATLEAREAVHQLLSLPLMDANMEDQDYLVIRECFRPENKTAAIQALKRIKEKLDGQKVSKAATALQREVFEKVDGFEIMKDENKEVLVTLGEAIFELEKNKEERATKAAREKVQQLLKMPLMSTHLEEQDIAVMRKCHRPENKPAVVKILTEIKFKLENSTLENMKVPQIPEINVLTEAMSGAMSDVRNQFRKQLTGIIEATAFLFEHLTELTKSMNVVREQNDAVIKICRENQEDMEMMEG